VSPEAFMKRLRERKLGNNESLESYYFDVLKLCDSVNKDMDDAETVAYLLT